MIRDLATLWRAMPIGERSALIYVPIMAYILAAGFAAIG